MPPKVAIPSGPRPKPRLKRKDPDAVHLMEEENFQLTFNWAWIPHARSAMTFGAEKLPDPQPDNAEATTSAHRDNDAESAAPGTEAKVVDPCLIPRPPCPAWRTRRTPPSTKQKTTRPSPFAGPSEHSRRLDDNDDDGDDPLPSPTSHIESIRGVATGTAGHLEDKMLVDVEHVEQLVLLGDATPSNGCVTASPRSPASSLEWPGSDVDFTQIEEEGDPYKAEPETKAFNEDISDDESDAYKPNDDNEDANKGEEKGEEEEEVLLSPKVIQTKEKVWTAPSKVKGGKKKAKRAVLLSNLEPTDKSDQEPEGRKSRKGPLSKEALTECEEFSREMEERAIALAKKFGKKPWSIFAAASLSMLASRKELVWNMHQSWFFATQGQDDMLRDSEEGEEKWDIMCQYYIEMAAGVESKPKSSVGCVMAAWDMFAKSAAMFCRLQNLHIFGFVIHTGVEEDSRQAFGMWAGSPLVRKIIDENHMDLKRMIDWWTMVIKFAHIQDSEEGPSMPAIGSGRVGWEPVHNHNQRVLKAMVLELLIPHGYVKWSILWKRLCHKAENLHFTILNWPEEVPVPDMQFDFHQLDANEVLKLLANFLINRLGPMYKLEGEGEGEGEGEEVGGPLAEAIPLVKSQTCPDKASMILLTVGGLHGKKPLPSLVDEHNKDVIDEEWPGLAGRDAGFKNTDNSDSARNAAHQGSPPLPSTQKRGRINDDINSNQFEEAVNTHDRVPVVKQAQGLPQEDGLHSAGDDYRQREVGLYSRKEQHGEYTRRFHSPGNTTSSDVKIHDRDTSRKPARHDKTHCPRSPPFWQEISDGNNVHHHHHSPSAGPCWRDPSHGHTVVRDEVMKTMGMGAGPMGTVCYMCCLVFLGNVGPPNVVLLLSEY
ncbi:hypothetical protein BDN67DRAFT_985978 [Paxillus ammoniavirescens]|nr:hypothetical protein BDN67DRAFT_985978 [Paxillus ammoniavirescens]